MNDYEKILSETIESVTDNIKTQFHKACMYGYEEGKKSPCDCKDNMEAEYNRGLNEAWECVKKIIQIDGDTTEKLFGDFLVYNIIQKYCVSDVLQIIKEYEEQQEQDTKIKVGDEVVTKHGTKGVVITNVASEEGMISVWLPICTHVQMYPLKNLSKTGRHFDQIDKVFAEMRGEE